MNIIEEMKQYRLAVTESIGTKTVIKKLEQLKQSLKPSQMSEHQKIQAIITALNTGNKAEAHDLFQELSDGLQSQVPMDSVDNQNTYHQVDAPYERKERAGVADDYCEACLKRVANYETEHGLLCDRCYKDLYEGRNRKMNITDEMKKYGNILMEGSTEQKLPAGIKDKNAAIVKGIASKMFDGIYSQGRIGEDKNTRRWSFYVEIPGFTFGYHGKIKTKNETPPEARKLLADLKENFLDECLSAGVPKDAVDLKYHIGATLYASVRVKLGASPAKPEETEEFPYDEFVEGINEAWDEKMDTKEKDKDKWKDWTLAELKAELKKLKAKKDKTEALKKREHQITFAIRAKQKNKWGKIKESVGNCPKLQDIMSQHSEHNDEVIDEEFSALKKCLTNVPCSMCGECNADYETETNGYLCCDCFSKHENFGDVVDSTFDQNGNDTVCSGCNCLMDECMCECQPCSKTGLNYRGEVCDECGGVGYGHKMPMQEDEQEAEHNHAHSSYLDLATPEFMKKLHKFYALGKTGAIRHTKNPAEEDQEAEHNHAHSSYLDLATPEFMKKLHNEDEEVDESDIGIYESELYHVLKMAGMNESDMKSVNKVDVDSFDEDTELANSPNEQTLSTETQMSSSNDLHRQKKQYAGFAKLGDNPRASAVEEKLKKNFATFLKENK